jgi:chorismate-pyruvate lyase
MLELLVKLEREISLSPVQKILLVTDGSVTRILEALLGCEIAVKTERQEVIEADKRVADMLSIDIGDEVNFRVVNLIGSSKVLMHAISYTPIKRLKSDFKEDIMKADIPIGRIMSRLKIEARRELRDVGFFKANKKFSSLFEIEEGALLLKRNYNIIHNNEILLNITEIFPYEAFR